MTSDSTIKETVSISYCFQVIVSLLVTCHPSGCTVVSGVVVGVCNHSQMRTSKCTVRLIFGVSIGLDPG